MTNDDDKRVQRAMNDALGMAVGWGLGALVMLALVWGVAGFAAALLAAIACFCTLAALVGFDRLYGIRATLSGRGVL